MSHPLTKLAADSATVAAGVTAPWWVETSTTWLGWLAAICAVLLGFGRLVLLYRDWRNGKQDR